MNTTKIAIESIRAIKRNPSQLFRNHTQYHCPLCKFTGWFVDIGERKEARCPSCGSRERDRTIAIYWQRNPWDFENGSILHLSPKKSIWPVLKDKPGYVSSDVKIHKRAAHTFDIQDIATGDQTFDYLICNHVLEHVERDILAMAECFRVLKPGGRALFSVPIDFDLEETWNPSPDMPQHEVEKICGAMHLRLYGQDFPDLLRQAGFEVEPITVSSEDDARCRLITHTADTVYVARRP